MFTPIGFSHWTIKKHGYSEMLEATRIFKLTPKDVFMLMLLHLNEDLDDNLLHDCLCLLGQEE